MQTAQPRPGLKTFSSFLGARKRPSEYDVVTYKLHYRTRNKDAAYEQDPNSPMNLWYKKYVTASPLQHPDWDSFRDPDQVTYRGYNTMQDAQEQFVDQLLDDHDANGHDLSLARPWTDTLETLYTPGRYLMTALQMAGAYVVQMAPASTITNCAAFQEADCFRWLSRIAYRTRELANHHPGRGFARDERLHWETLPAWQGYRELLERTLATYDWAENLVALNLVAMRAVEVGFIQQLGAAARAAGDTLTAMLCDNHMRDCERSRRWTAAFVKTALEAEGNKALMARWLAKWVPLGDQAIETYCTALPDSARAIERARLSAAEFRAGLGFD
jgi:toluene monooxygenase system protein E